MQARTRPVLAALALTLTPLAARADWRSYDRDDGLPNNEVHVVFPASDGTVWFGCAAGAVRSDGVRWQRFLDDAFVNSVAEGDSGAIWIATASTGAYRIHGSQVDTFTVASTDRGLASDRVTQVVRLASGAYWFGTYDAGASRYDGRQWFRIRAPTLASDAVYAIAEDQQRTLWFGTDQGVTRWSANGEFTTFRTADGLPSDAVRALVVDEHGTVWVGTRNGIARYASSLWSTLRAGVDVQSIGREPDGTWWFGTTTGVLRWDGREWLQFDTMSGLAGPEAQCIAPDQRGNLWVATNGGASRFDGERVGWYALDPVPPGGPWVQVPLPSNFVTAVLGSRDGRTWLGTDAGLVRYDAAGWTTLRVADGLPHAVVRDVVETAAGAIWIATAAGVARLESGGTLTAFRVGDGLPSDDVRALAAATDGTIWAATAAGAAQFQAGAWRAVALALPSIELQDVALDADGTRWFATARGLARCDDAGCTAYTTVDGLVRNDVRTVCADSRGTVWCGTIAGVSAFDGASWHTYRSATSGLAGDNVRAITEDATGGIWFGSSNGLSRLQDGTAWQTFRLQDGLVSLEFNAIAIDAREHLWLGSTGGVGTLEPDTGAPATAILSAPASISTSRSQRLSFGAGFGEVAGIEFSVSEDDGVTWSPWLARETTWSRAALVDGVYHWRVRCRDAFANVDAWAPAAVFEIDATPPAPVVASPAFGAVVRGVVAVEGTTADTRFATARLEWRAAGGGWVELARLDAPATDRTLATWDTRPLPDGLYEIRLTVEDALGLATSTLVVVHADNVPPFADRTTPARIRAAAGGEAFSLDGTLRVYFAPQAFDADAVVMLEPADTSSVAIVGARALAVYDVTFAGGQLRAPGTIEIAAPHAAADRAIWRREGTEAWVRVGGRIDGPRVVAPLPSAGTYALVAGGAVPNAAPTLSAVALTPAVFSPTGAFAADRVAIAFEIGRSGPVSVRLYNRAGRLVRHVTQGEPMTAGANVVYWDGRDAGGQPVVPGPYIVHVGAPGGERVATVVVTR